jgi:hypothetical protein
MRSSVTPPLLMLELLLPLIATCGCLLLRMHTHI